MFSILRRVWIPLVVVMLVAMAGFAVFRLHGIVGSAEAGSSDMKDEPEPIIPKDVIYEVFGPAETKGKRIS